MFHSFPLLQTFQQPSRSFVIFTFIQTLDRGKIRHLSKIAFHVEIHYFLPLSYLITNTAISSVLLMLFDSIFFQYYLTAFSFDTIGKYFLHIFKLCPCSPLQVLVRFHPLSYWRWGGCDILDWNCNLEVEAQDLGSRVFSA